MAVAGYTHGATRRRTPLDDLQDQIDALTKAHDNIAGHEKRIEQLEKQCETLARQLAIQARQTTSTATIKPALTGRRSYPADRAKERITELNRSGLRMREIAEASGVSLPVIVGIHTGKRATVSPRIEALILALKPRKERP